MLNLLIWIVSGLSAGWLVRIAMKSSRGYGIVGDLTLGSLGALIGEWILRRMSITAPDDVVTHILVAALGAAVLVAGLRLLRHAYQATGLQPLTPGVSLAQDLETQVKRLGDVERRVLAAVLKRRPLVQDPTKAFDAQLTFGQRVADRVAAFGGSWTFIGLFATIILGWILLNDTFSSFDPFPYILLNLVLSCVAAVQAPVIMMSQNRQVTRDRIEARSDYEVNLRAEVEIMSLHAKLDATRDQDLAEFLKLQHEQLDVLREIAVRIAKDA